MKNKAWKKPELVIVNRSQPEEIILTSCKFLSEAGLGPNNANAGCHISGCTGDCAVAVLS
jgi:hypothetical protein